MNSTPISQCFFDDDFNRFYTTCNDYEKSMLQRSLLSHDDLRKHHYRNVPLDESQIEAIIHGDNLYPLIAEKTWSEDDSVKAKHAFDDLDGTLQRDIVFKLVWTRKVLK